MLYYINLYELSTELNINRTSIDKSLGSTFGLAVQVATVMTTKLIGLAFLVIMGAICATYGQHRRYTACPPTIEQFMTAYPHPFDCRKFFYCVLGNLVEFKCPGIMYFDRYRKTCMHPLAVKCSKYPIRSSTPSTVPEWVTTTFTTSLTEGASERTAKDTASSRRLTDSTITSTVPITSRTNACGRVHYINETSGYFVSPYYPNNYMNNMDCNYNITAPPGTFLSLYVNRLDLEIRFDYVEIFHGTNNDSTRLTGSEKKDIYANSNSVRVHFHSDRSVVRSGFNISFTASACAGPRSYTGESGSIVSPGFRNFQYANNLNCYYNINTPSGSRVVLRIRYFDVENNNIPGQCPKDYLKIYDGPSSDYLPLATLCGTILATNTYYASTNRVSMHFHTNNAVTRPGFNISYSSIPSNAVSTTSISTAFG